MEQPGKAADASWSRAWWAYADRMRQRQGEFMDRLGLGPETTPCRVVKTSHIVQLLAYQEPDRTRPALLIVPAPIKAAYIWDLAPEISVVKRCLDAGIQVYLMAWRRPQPGDETMGLADYADRLILDCLETLAAETGQPKAFLAGHSLGGTLAAVFTSLHPQTVHGLIELEGPMQFAPDAGRLETAVARSPAAGTVTEVFGNIPGSFLNIASRWADPLTFSNEPLMDWFESLSSPRANRIYLQVRRWTLDETPLPQRLFEEIVEDLYRENRFADGTLMVGERPADPRSLSMPILAITDPRSRIIPSVSVEAYRHRTASGDVQLLEYEGDVGVMLQHVGILVGESAHQLLWPRIVAWMRDHAAGTG